jgi:hypothetical protein
MALAKPRKRMAIFWLCGAKTCRTRHMTKALAAKCPKRLRTPRKEIAKIAAARRRLIYRLRNSGLTFREIARYYGISRTRVSQIYCREKRRIERLVEHRTTAFHSKLLLNTSKLTRYGTAAEKTEPCGMAGPVAPCGH